MYAFNADDEATADVNEDGTVDRDDAVVLYYAYTFSTIIKETGAHRVALRRALFHPRKGDHLAGTDANYLKMVENAEKWQTANAGGDLNASGAVDRDDAVVMYYAYTFSGIIKEPGAGRVALRRALFRPRKGTLDADDASYLKMIADAESLQ